MVFIMSAVLSEQSMLPTVCFVTVYWVTRELDGLHFKLIQCFSISPKYKETADDVSVLVSFYLQGRYDSLLWTELVEGLAVCSIHAPCGQTKRDKQILVITKVGVPGIKGKTDGQSAIFDRGLGSDEEKHTNRGQSLALQTFPPCKPWASTQVQDLVEDHQKPHPEHLLNMSA